ncbi:WD repeat protein [Klosneuvirus KNV1]|uniref:WD repeat protein n=1 Tax=Klosneuvirus KNV1 TaxID=1977640 RepID=A0A1V0SL36_9VIRU|nr:WD repeat protein [Klosneuvirus KNV1]
MSINNLAFNNLMSTLTCSTNQGFIIYSIKGTLEKKIYMDQLNGGVGLTKIFNNSNMLILVGGGQTPFKSKDTLVLWDQCKNRSIVEIDLKEPIKNALITNDTIIIVIEDKICLFQWDGNYVDSKSTYTNEKGLCVINSDKNILVTLGAKKGEIAIWKYKFDSYKTIEAHLTNIETLAISNNGIFVATASERGTLIRVYNIETLTLEYEFRRGSQSASIYDICFNKDGSLLACSSSNGTIHLFDLSKEENTKNVKSMLATFQNFLPKYFSSQWGFKQITITDMSKNICNFDDQNDLHVATFDGNYYRIAGRNNEFTDIIQSNLHVNTK